MILPQLDDPVLPETLEGDSRLLNLPSPEPAAAEMVPLPRPRRGCWGMVIR